MTDEERARLAAWLREWHADPRSGDQTFAEEVWVALVFAHLDQARAGDGPAREYAERRIVPFIVSVLATLDAPDVDEWRARLEAHIAGGS